ncbi:apolipophorins-like [Pollicipes pollicipes]|uniref:apolipophorins-like n=1 Tax=Pollicipes pollicipes TaxID=41117 RepID=UPI001884D13B|nr:apolipophorins-like [Pollicipes pollicipes]
MRRHAALLSLLLAAGAVAGPTDPRAGHRCASYCLSADNSKFAYTAGQTYVYAYTSDVVTTLAGATDEASRLHVKATAEIAANSACDFTLQLRDVTLEDSDPKNVDRRRHVDDMASFKDELEKYPLSFSYQDGRVEELCSSQFESVWALNFKRGLLSATVNNLETLDLGETQKYETDVSGYCSTNYTVRNLGDITAVIKTKELLTCRERGHLVSSLQTTPYHSASNIQSMPLLRSTQRCRQAVSAGRLLTVVCQEDHLFRPFSGGGNGAVTRTTLTLTEMNVRPTVHTRQHEPLRVRSSAMFDHSAPELKAVDRADATRLLLAEMQRQTAEDVRREVPRLFTQLVQTLRQADAASLARLLREQTQQTTRKYLMDALPMLGTAAALVVMRDMVMLGQVASEETDRWMTSLAFVHEPRLDMVEAVAPLLADAGVRTQTLLGVSAMLHRFCRADVDCAQRPAVRQAVSSIEQLLGGDCASESRGGRTRVLAALKALGNVGLLIRGEGVLRACFASKDDVETRLEAIRAYRRMPCAVVSNSGLVHTFANHLENSEVRIAAYLAVTQCATHEVVDKLMEILSKETVNQVGSFVWTHITNMQETNDPSKQYLKSLLYNVELSKKFATDARKFSRYYEKSAFFESVNAGGSVEGAVVFSPESYIPRSGMLNLTVDLFGEAINLLEVGGRVEGLEHYVENLFGNKGPYPQESISQILRTMRGRPSSNDITRLSDAYNAANDASGSFHASSYVKIFGNELSFGTFDDLSALVRALGDDGPVSFLQKLAKDRDWTDNYQFLDTSYTIPTMIGLPFKLRAVGAATVTLKTSGRFNIESWNKMNIEGFIKPSAAVEIAAEMSVDAYVARTGLKMNTNLHTSTALDGQVVIDSAKIVSIKMNMPKDKVEMLDVRTSFHSVYQNQEIPLETTSNKVEYGACSEAYTAAALGVNICSEICYPLPAASGASFLLTGPLTARITVEKTDTVKAFIFEYRHSNEAGVRKSSLMLDTPGTTTNRHINLDYMINFRNKAFRVGIITPVKSVELAGSLDVATERKHAALQLDIDRREIFGVTGSLTKNDTLRAVEYQPLVVIRGSSGPLFRLKGEVLVNKDKPKYAVRLRANTLYNYPIVLTGSVDEDDGMYSIATSLSSRALTGTLNGMFRHDGTSLVLQTATEYSVLDGPTRTISLNTKMDKEALGEQALYKLSMETKLSALPLLDTELRAELARSPGQHRATAELMLGQRRYQLSAGLGDQRGRRFGEIAFQAAHMDVDFKLATELDMSTKQRLQLSTMARLNQDRFAGGSLTVSYLSEGFNFDYGVDTNITLMTSSYALVAQVRRDDGTADLTFLASREVGSESRTVRLAAALGLDETDAHTLDASLDLPNYPSTRLSGRLAAGK